MKKGDVIIFFLAIAILANISMIFAATITYSSRNATLGSSGNCIQNPVLITSDLTGVASIKVSNINGFICSRRAAGCSDKISDGCASGFKHDCSDGTQGTIAFYDASNKLKGEYSMKTVKDGVSVPAGATKVYVYFKDSNYGDNNGGYKCKFDYEKTMTCTPICIGKQCGDDGCGTPCPNTCSGSKLKCNSNNCVECTINSECSTGKFCNPDTWACEDYSIPVTCPSDQIIMKLFQYDNSHGALWDDINYNINICYDEIFDDEVIFDDTSHDCKGDPDNPVNAVLWLSSSSNAHASAIKDEDDGVYTTPVCFDDLNCKMVEDDECDEGEFVVVKLSSPSNAHFGYSISNYPVKICCKKGIDIINWADMMNNPIDSTQNGDSVKLIVNKPGIKDKEIKYSIYEKESLAGIDILWRDRIAAQFDDIGYNVWKINVNEFGTYYFEAEIMSTNEKISSKGKSFGEIEIDINPDDAFPIVELNNPVYNSDYGLGSNGLTNQILFEPVIYDEDDDINMTLSFGDENITKISNCLTTVDCNNIAHIYKSSGTKSIKIVAQESTRNLYANSCTRIFVFKEGMSLFSIIDSPDCYNEPNKDAGLLDISGKSSYVSECSDSQDSCNSLASVSGKICYPILEGTSSIPSIYCYKKAEAYDSVSEACDNKFTFNWFFDDGADNEHKNCSSFKKLFFDRGEHIINLKLVYNY